MNLVATEIVEVHNGAVTRYAGSYADYVYHLEVNVRRELTADQRGVSDQARVAKAPSDYHLRKQQASARRKLAGQITRAEEQLNNYRKEQEALEDELAANPAAWTHALVQRIEALARLLREEEQRWIQLTEQLELLSAQTP